MSFVNIINSPLGIDISGSSIKLVQLSKAGKKIKIKALNHAFLDEGIIDNGEVKNREKLINYLKLLVSKPQFGSINLKEAVVSLPESKTYLKLITIEKSQNNINDLIENEILKHIPMSLENVYYDWQIIEEDVDSYSILVGICPKNIVDEYIEIFNKANLSIIALEIESISICRALIPEENPSFLKEREQFKNYGIIDIGSQRTTMIIYTKNTIVLSIELPISGHAVTEKIINSLKITRDQAEKAKIVCGMDPEIAEGIVKNILEEMAENLLKKIETTLDFYVSNFPNNNKLDKILLCGGGAQIKNLHQYLTKNLGIETVNGNPFVNISGSQNNSKEFDEKYNIEINFGNNVKSKKLSIEQNNSLSYTSAIGLALRNFFIF